MEEYRKRPSEEIDIEQAREIGALGARMTSVEESIHSVRQDQARLFQGMDDIKQAQAMLNVKLDQHGQMLEKFVTQCSICRIDFQQTEQRVTQLEKSTSTDAIRKASEPLVEKARGTKAWNKSMEDLTGDILYGGIKSIGIGVVIVLILWASGKLNLDGSPSVEPPREESTP